MLTLSNLLHKTRDFAKQIEFLNIAQKNCIEIIDIRNNENEFRCFENFKFDSFDDFENFQFCLFDDFFHDF